MEIIIDHKQIEKLIAFMNGPRPDDPDERRLWKILNHSKNYKMSQEQYKAFLHKEI